MGYYQFRCLKCDKLAVSENKIKYHIMKVHEKKRRMADMSIAKEEFFKNPITLYEDYKQTKPHTFPTRDAVVKALKQALQTETLEQTPT